MRTIILAAVVVWLVPGSAVRADDKESRMLEGTWQLVKGQVAGNEFPPQVAKGIKLTISPGKYVVTAESKDEGTVKYFPDASPKAMEVTGTAGPNKGKTYPAIYELKGDKLIVCYDLSGTARPTEFASKAGTKLFLATYEKVKNDQK